MLWWEPAAIKPLQQWAPHRGALAKYLLIAGLAGAGAIMRCISTLSGGTDTHCRHLMALVLMT